MPDFTPSEFADRFAETGKDSPPFYFGRRFDADGRFLYEPGNTIVCHVVPGSPTETALVKVRDALLALPHGDRFTWTPVSSYHMTVFQGVIEGRRKPGYWPHDLALDMEISETTRLLCARLEGLAPPGPFRMRLKRVTPLGLTLEGVIDADEAAVRAFRDRLADRFGYRHPDHDHYAFHITLSYIKQWLPAEATETYISALSTMGSTFAAEAPTIDLGPAEFCVFDDMNAFRPVLRLG